MDEWDAAQYADECVRMQQTLEALKAAERAGTPVEHIITLAYEAGVGGIYKPGNTRNDTNRTERT